MNYRFPMFALALLISAASVTDLTAQIRDDEQSTSYLAVQCALSGGGDSANYEKYGRKLAKTVALLSPGQQKRVFGYVPQPITFASPEDPVQSNDENNGLAANTSDSDSPTDDAPESEIGNGGADDEDSTPLAAAPPSEEESGIGNLSGEAISEDSAETLEEEDSGNDWWGGLVDWLDGLFESIVDDLAKKQQSSN